MMDYDINYVKIEPKLVNLAENNLFLSNSEWIVKDFSVD